MTSADETEESRYKLTELGDPEGGPEPDYVAYVLFFSVASLFVSCTN